MLEAVQQAPIVDENDKLNVLKLEVLELIPKLLHSLMKHKFPDAEADSPTDAKGFYEDI